MENKNIVLSTAVEEGVFSILEVAAKKRKESRSDYLRRALALALEADGFRLPAGFEIKRSQGQRTDMKTKEGRKRALEVLDAAREKRMANVAQRMDAEARKIWLSTQGFGKEGVRFLTSTMANWEKENGEATERIWKKFVKTMSKMARRIDAESEDIRRLEADPREFKERHLAMAKARWDREDGREEARLRQEKIKQERSSGASRGVPDPREDSDD